MLLLFLGVALRGESRRHRLQVPNPVGEVPSQEGAHRPDQFVRQVVEVNTGADKHPQPNHHDQIQGDVEQVEHSPGQSRVAGGLHQGHGGHLLHDEEGGVGENEAVSRDVVAVPVETGPPARHFGHKLLLDDVLGDGVEARAGHVLDVEEGADADVPNGRGDSQRQQAAAEEVRATAEGGVAEEDEGREQQQGPPPRQLDHVPARGEHTSNTSVAAVLISVGVLFSIVVQFCETRFVL